MQYRSRFFNSYKNFCNDYKKLFGLNAIQIHFKIVFSWGFVMFFKETTSNFSTFKLFYACCIALAKKIRTNLRNKTN